MVSATVFRKDQWGLHENWYCCSKNIEFRYDKWLYTKCEEHWPACENPVKMAETVLQTYEDYKAKRILLDAKAVISTSANAISVVIDYQWGDTRKSLVVTFYLR